MYVYDCNDVCTIVISNIDKEWKDVVDFFTRYCCINIVWKHCLGILVTEAKSEILVKFQSCPSEANDQAVAMVTLIESPSIKILILSMYQYS